MNENEQLIEAFYQAFQNKDWKTMKTCYSEEVMFNDSVFKNLDYYQTTKMWEMLLKRGKDLKLVFSNIEATGSTGKATWVATYTFSTGNKVENHIQANFEIKDGKIIKHTDSFDFYEWAKQAFGITGRLIGWTGFFRSKVQTKALEGLEKYIQKNP
ncbi:MAG: nuclear transport factor 2 family protein [Saprospiraceae bacterium]